MVLPQPLWGCALCAVSSLAGKAPCGPRTLPGIRSLGSSVSLFFPEVLNREACLSLLIGSCIQRQNKDCLMMKAVTALIFFFFFLPMQTSSVFHSTNMCGDHRFGRIEMVSSQNSEEREKEMSPQLHPEALVAGFRRSGSQSPDSRLVGDAAPPSHHWAQAEVSGAWLPAGPGGWAWRGTGYRATWGHVTRPLCLPLFLIGKKGKWSVVLVA